MGKPILRRIRWWGKWGMVAALCAIGWAPLAGCATEPPPVASAPSPDPCSPKAPHAQAVANLGSAPWHERVVAQALDADGNVIEFFASIKGESWTILQTSPDGMSCVLSAGEGWEMSDPRGEGA